MSLLSLAISQEEQDNYFLFSPCLFTYSFFLVSFLEQEDEEEGAVIKTAVLDVGICNCCFYKTLGIVSPNLEFLKGVQLFTLDLSILYCK